MKENSGISFIKLVFLVAIIIGIVAIVKANSIGEEYKNVTGGELKVMEVPLNISYAASYTDLFNVTRNIKHNNSVAVSPFLNRSTGEINPIFSSKNSVLEQYVNGETRTDSVIGKNPENLGTAPYALEFKTDADEIIFFASSNVRVSVDKLDGKGYVMSSFEGCDNGNGYVYVDFGANSIDMKNVKIETEGAVGPFLVNLRKKMEPADSTQKKMLFIGDSWAEGQAIEEGKRYLSYSNIIADRLDMVCINNGVAGSGYHELEDKKAYIDRVDKELEIFHPDVIVVNGGGNDMFSGKTTDSVKEKARTLYEKLKNYQDDNSGVKVVIIGVEYYEGVPEYDVMFRNLNQKLLKVAKEYNLPFIDLTNGNTYGADGKKVTKGKDPYIIKSDVDDYIASDTIHPSQEGHKYLGNALAAEMEKALISVK